MKKFFIWLIAIILTLSAVIYQRVTGPTYPIQKKLIINGKEYKLKFIRSHGGETDAEVSFLLPQEVSGILFYKRYPTNEDFVSKQMQYEDGKLKAFLPHQPPAGKLMYYIILYDKIGSEIYNNKSHPVIIRFKGDVPAAVLIPHIIFMFSAMLFAILAAIFAVFNFPEFRKWTFVTFIVLFIGGIILGPLVQKYAFGEFWTGIPFGWDLTDNKTLIAVLGWTAAVIANWKEPRRWMVVFAALLQIIVYSIPHSLYGSQLDYSTGNMVQGFIWFLF